MAQPIPGAARFVPVGADLETLKRAALKCQGCHLHENATQTVFGRGNSDARLVLVGEQPGDVEDRHGLPFVGPAGALLRRAVDDAGIGIDRLYITNVVKHFSFVQRGPRRIHKTPEREEIIACRPWLVAEFAQLRPRGIVALGATAAQALLGAQFRVTRSRGQIMSWPASAAEPGDYPVPERDTFVMATLHPSAVLRADNQDEAYAGLVADLTVAAKALTA